jgi:hypothetical protein
MDELTPEEVVFTTTHHVSIIRAILIQYMPSYFFKIHLLPLLPSRLFSSGFRAEILYEFLFYLTRATCPPHTILLNLVTRKYSVNSTNHEVPHFDLVFHLLYLEFFCIFLWSLPIASAVVFAFSYTIKVISTYFRRQRYSFLLSNLYITLFQHSAEII